MASIDTQVKKIIAARKAATDTGIPIVINTRTDIYWLGIGKENNRLKETIKRLTAFQAAGADCLFIPGIKDIETISALIKSVKKPINILGGLGVPSTHKLKNLGVARVSIGSSAMRATLTCIEDVADELKNKGTYTFAENIISYPDMNRLMSS